MSIENTPQNNSWVNDVIDSAMQNAKSIVVQEVERKYKTAKRYGLDEYMPYFLHIKSDEGVDYVYNPIYATKNGVLCIVYREDTEGREYAFIKGTLLTDIPVAFLSDAQIDYYKFVAESLTETDYVRRGSKGGAYGIASFMKFIEGGHIALYPAAPREAEDELLDATMIRDGKIHRLSFPTRSGKVSYSVEPTLNIIEHKIQEIELVDGDGNPIV